MCARLGHREVPVSEPVDLPASFACGTRSSYVRGCRCEPCRRANADAHKARVKRVREAAADVEPSGPPLAGVLMRGGRAHRVRRCPGAGGVACVQNPPTWLKDPTRGVCLVCVSRAKVWNGLIDAKPLAKHMRKLRKRGLGYKAVADAADVSRTVLCEVMTGHKTQVRADTARRVLQVDHHAVADHALVDAAPTWKLLEQLFAQGYSRNEIGRQLGHRSRVQLGRKQVTAKNALAVRRLHARLHGGLTPTRPMRMKLRTLRIEGYAETRLRDELGEHADTVLRLPPGRKTVPKAASAAVDAMYLRLMT